MMTDLERDVQLRLSPYQQRSLSQKQQWQKIQDDLKKQNNRDFKLHLTLYQAICNNHNETPVPAWFCDNKTRENAQLTRWMRQYDVDSYQALHEWSHLQYQDFWQAVMTDLNIKLDEPYKTIADTSNGIEAITWLPGARLNIANSCFNADKENIAIIENTSCGNTKKMTYAELNAYSNQVANTLMELNFKRGDAIAIDMCMNSDAVAIYLGIIKAGMIVVSIADSFAAQEVQSRLNIANAKAIFVHDILMRNNKQLPLYEKIVGTHLPQAIVVPYKEQLAVSLRKIDHDFASVLSQNNQFASVSCDPHDYTNILFSSGTTGTPKAIPWTHTTPIRCASDALFHQDIHEGDVLCWPTNLGWMMGPWLIYATLINRATLALYDDAPNGERFGRFVQNAHVTMLGLVPSMVKAWRISACMENCDWSGIKVFSSSGECSNPDDMFYLMFLAHYKPIIEYCGGTEIGGAYISSTVIEDNTPSLFSTATMGLDFKIINTYGEASDEGEVVIVPPSLGLSTQLLNRDHHQEYFSQATKLTMLTRKHGDKIKRLDRHHYRLLGRNDDTMNLGGIKTSAVEIERVLNNLPNILETAAIAIAEDKGGADQLIIYVCLQPPAADDQDLLGQCQRAIRQQLNPLFKIHDIVVCEALPKTASNKIMRNDLRIAYKRRKQ